MGTLTEWQVLGTSNTVSFLMPRSISKKPMFWTKLTEKKYFKMNVRISKSKEKKQKTYFFWGKKNCYDSENTGIKSMFMVAKA